MADGFVTPAKMAARSYGSGSSASGALTTNYVNKAGCSLTTTGRPVLIVAQIGVLLENTSETSAVVSMLMTRPSVTVLLREEWKTVSSGTVSSENRNLCFCVLDVPPVGSTTYTFSAKKDSSADSSMLSVNLFAVEL